MRKTRVVVLCEDRAHWHFTRGYLVRRGWNGRQLTPRVSPFGRGSAEQWVREHFAQELKAYRSKAHENICLIVMMDGDNRSRYRILELDQAVHKSGLQVRREDERIAIFIPNRNLETWFAWLDGEPVDEKTDYKAKYRKGARRCDFGRQLVDRCNQDSGFDGAPDSLLTACTEWRRIGG